MVKAKAALDVDSCIDDYIVDKMIKLDNWVRRHSTQEFKARWQPFRFDLGEFLYTEAQERAFLKQKIKTLAAKNKALSKKKTSPKKGIMKKPTMKASPMKAMAMKAKASPQKR